MGRSLLGTSSEKKLLHNVTSGAHVAVPHVRILVTTPVIHYCIDGWRLMVSALAAFVRRPQEVEAQCLGRVGLSAGRDGDCGARQKGLVRVFRA